MKISRSWKIRFARIATVVALTSACLLPLARAGVVYDNTANDKLTNFNTLSFEVGDEILLGSASPLGLSYVVTNLQFDYFGSGFDGGEALRIRFYNNDGTAGAPGSTLWDSQAISVGAAARAGVTITTGTDPGDLGVNGVLVPERMTWSIQFSGIGGSESAGVPLFGPPTVGNNFQDYWQLNGSTWELKAFGDTDLSFHARFMATAVPEPGTYALMGLGGALMFWLGRRNRR